MSSYKYSQSKLVDKVTFRISENGAKRAYLHAAANASPEAMDALKKGLALQGYSIVPITFEGEPSLEVRGFWRDKSVIKSLTEMGAVSGPSTILKDVDKKKTIKQKILDHSLRWTSGFFMLADACYAMYGYKESRVEDVLAGGSYFIGSATMGALGTSAQSQAEIRKQVKKLISYTKEHNLNFDQNITVPIVTENNKRDVLHKIVDTLQTYPAEIGNSFTGLAGSLIAYSSLKHRVFGKEKAHLSAEGNKGLKSAGWKDVGLGTSTLASGLVGALIKEKKIDPDAPKKHGFAALWQWVESKPLRVAAFGYMLSTACHTLSTIQEHGIAKKEKDMKMLGAVKWRAGFIASTIVGEVLLALSSKGHGHGVKSDVSTEDSVLSIAAEIIAQQKPAMQGELISNIGNFLGREDVLGGKDKNVQQRLAARVQEMCRNPWAFGTKASPVPAACAVPTETVPAPTLQPAIQHAATVRTPKPMPDWQGKMAKDTAAGAELNPSH